jgi:hypothetical protein
MYHVVNNSTGITVARFSNRQDALYWISVNNNLPAPRTAEQVNQDTFLEPIEATPDLYRLVLDTKA